MNVGSIAAYKAARSAFRTPNSSIRTPSTAGEIAELQVMQDAIDAGTADLYYYEGWQLDRIRRPRRRVRPDPCDEPDAPPGAKRRLPRAPEHRQEHRLLRRQRHRPARHLRAVRHHLGEAQARRQHLRLPARKLERPAHRWHADLRRAQPHRRRQRDRHQRRRQRDRHARVAGVVAHHGRRRSATTSRISTTWPTAASISSTWAPDRPRSISKSSP